ncbi:hypothetical protein GCM10010310_00120 [Streptomyces violaceolatus]|uniref:Uncharacterized protein n=1 Tax=Streptomyces violaceolatus TaxID=67378 RepID=A0ABN3S1T5_9ACTN
MDREWGTAWCPAAFRSLTTCEPISPVPPMTAIFMRTPLFLPEPGGSGTTVSVCAEDGALNAPKG